MFHSSDDDVHKLRSFLLLEKNLSKFCIHVIIVACHFVILRLNSDNVFVRRAAYILVLWLMAFSARSQTINLSDSLRQVFREKPIPTAKLDSRNSFISGRSARVHGVKAGVSFGKKLTLGLGYNWIADGIEQETVINGLVQNTDVRLRYIAPFIEYSFYKKGNWEAVV